MQQQVTPALGHNYAMVPAKPATYFHAGHTDGVQCTRCSEWLIEADEISKLTGEGAFCDVDGDGTVTIVDATFIQRKLASVPIPFEMDENMGDADEDGILTIIDATYIQRYLASLPSNENIGKMIT